MLPHIIGLITPNTSTESYPESLIFINFNHVKIVSSFAFLIISNWICAQPNTEVYLFDINKELKISNPINISNNDGYDNQPSFWEDGKSILYSRTVNGQTEIARYFIASKKTKIITNTRQGSEYSPTQMTDGRISSIRLDTTGLQRLYAYNLKGKSEVLVPNLVIGYHTWINENFLAAFVLGEPPTLQVINTGSKSSKIVLKNIGRSLHQIPRMGNVSFVDKSREPWGIYSLQDDESTLLFTNTLEGSEDYCWTPDGDMILMGQGSKLFYWKRDDEWKAFADLETFGLGNISRISISPNGAKLAVVVAN